MMLALVMTSGSFLVSMAAVEGDGQTVDAPAASANTSDTVQDAMAEDDAKAAPEDAHIHSEECEHCKAEEIKVIEIVSPQIATVTAPAANSVADAPELLPNTATNGADNKDDVTSPPIADNPDGQQDQESPKTETVPDKPEIEVPNTINGHKVNKDNIEWSDYHEPTCLEGGYYEVTFWCIYKDNGCGITKPHSGFLGTKRFYVADALGHDLGDWVVVKEPSVEEEGERARFCRVCEEKIETEVIEKLKEIVPTYVTVDGPEGSMNAIVDDKGNAVLKGFFMELEKGSGAEETVKMSVGGATYTITRYADGKVTGQLPPGFKVSGTDLVVSNVSGDLDIRVLEHTALGGGTYYDPGDDNSVGDGYLSEDGSYYEPVAAGTRNRNTAATNDNRNNADSINAYAESLLNNLTGEGADNAAAADTEETPSASSFFKTEPRNGSTANTMIEKIEASPSVLVIAVDVALISALILGIGVLWKLGILNLKR